MTNIKKWESEENNWVEVDLNKCAGTAACVEVCPAAVYELVNGKVSAEDIGECVQCMACQDACPTGAILRHFAWEG